MKNIQYIYLVLILFSSCSQEEENTLTPSNPFIYDWYFEINVDGVSNRIEGTFSDASYSDALAHTSGPNKAYLTFSSSNTIMTAILANKGENTYVSGESFHINLSISNLSLGNNYFSLSESADVNESFIGVNQFDVSGISNALSGSRSFYFTSLDTNYNHYGNSDFPINITQLPTSSSIVDYSTGAVDIGLPILGSGSETIYVLDSIVGTTYSYSRAYDIEISFKLYSTF